jgi:5-methylcytosine-specific restriction endonuclease McrA
MSKRQKQWARVTRARLIRSYGGKCSCCGGTEHLQFHLLRPAREGHHGRDTSSRTSFYRRQARQANLQLVCARCHTAITSYQRTSVLTVETVNKTGKGVNPCG